MAKNNVKTIINTLNSKLRKKDITNSDKKEIKQIFTQLADEIAQGYQLSQDEAGILQSTYGAYKEEVTEAIAALSREQQIAFESAVRKANSAPSQEQEEVKEQESVVSPDAQTTKEKKEETIVAEEQVNQADTTRAASEKQNDEDIEEAVIIEEQVNQPNTTRAASEKQNDEDIEDAVVVEEQVNQPNTTRAASEKQNDEDIEDAVIVEEQINQPDTPTATTEAQAQQADTPTATTEAQAQQADTPTATTEAQAQQADTAEATTEEQTQQAATSATENENKEEKNEQPIVLEFEDEGKENTAEANSEEQQPEPEPLTEEEKNKYLDEIRSSHTMDGYMATIEYPISEKNIEASIALGPTKAEDGVTEQASAAENRAQALQNVDDMLVAMNYCAKNGKDAEIDEAIVARLQGFSMKDINPDNAYALLALADKIKGNTALYDEITNKIATALRNFDYENFGKLSEQDLNKNYNNASEELKDFIPYGDDKKPTLWAYTFTDDKGNVLKDKNRSNLNPRRWISGKGNDALKNEEAILNMARELAAQELASMPAETDPAKRKEQLNKVMNDKIAMLLNDVSGKKTFNQTEIAVRMAVGHNKAETFRNRVAQKFKNSKWGKDITDRLQKLDKQLTDTYGKKYTLAKKYTKMIGKIGLETAKSNAMFAIAGLANPIGIPALIAYNTVKQWKTMKKQLTDPSISKAKKCAMLLGAGVSATLGMVTAATGLGAAASAIGLDTPAMIQTLTNAGGALGIAGRTAVSTLAATVPNWVEKTSIYFKKKGIENQMKDLGPDGKPKPDVLDAYNQKVAKLQDKINQTQAQIGQSGNFKKIIRNFFKMDEKKLAKLNKQMEDLQKQAPKDMTALLAEEKALKKQSEMNRDELIGKALGSGIGITLAQTQVIPSLINNGLEQLQETTTTAVHSIAATATEHGMNPWLQEDHRVSWENINEDMNWQQHSAEADSKTEIHVPYREGVEPQEFHGIASHETNLEAAKAENSSGIEGKSSFAHTLQHLESLGDNRITDTNAMAEGLSEHIGKDANLATIACKMAPHALQQVLHIEGLPDNNPSSYNMINYLANHDLTPEQTTALNNFIQQNFEGAHFKTENFADYNHTPQNQVASTGEHRMPPEVHKTTIQEEYAQAKQAQQDYQKDNSWRHNDIPPSGNKLVDSLNDLYAQTNDANNGYHFDPTQKDHEQKTVVVQETAPTNQTPVDQQTEIYVDMTPEAYAAARGWTYDPVLSNGIDRIGGNNHSGYWAAFIINNDGSVIIMPNDPVHDKPMTYKTIDAARTAQRHYTGAYDHSGHDRNMIYDPDARVTRYWGNGNITPNNTINKVITAVNTAGMVIGAVQAIRNIRS